MGATTVRAEPAAPAREIKIGIIDTLIYRVPIRDRNVILDARDMTDGNAARWDGESGHTHGELVAASAIHAARIQNPDSPIRVFAANVYRPSAEDASLRGMRRPMSDPDASKVHLTLDYIAAAKAVTWLADNGVSVVVITATGRDTAGMKALVQSVRDAGMLLVASTNNVDVRGKVFPAGYPTVISVAGSDKSLPIWTSPELASYVSYVADARAPIKGEPEEIGSSFAAGSVAGVLAAHASEIGKMTSDDARLWLDTISKKELFAGHVLGYVATDIRHNLMRAQTDVSVVARSFRKLDVPFQTEAALAAGPRGIAAQAAAEVIQARGSKPVASKGPVEDVADTSKRIKTSLER